MNHSLQFFWASAHLLPLLLSMGCGGDSDDTGDKLQPESSAHLDVCLEANRLATEGCHDLLCAEAEPLTCTYGEVSVDGDDCGCRTEWQLYTELCDDRNRDSLDVVQASLVCD
jgi:hypothetical protein